MLGHAALVDCVLYIVPQYFVLLARDSGLRYRACAKPLYQVK